MRQPENPEKCKNVCKLVKKYVRIYVLRMQRRAVCGAVGRGAEVLCCDVALLRSGAGIFRMEAVVGEENSERPGERPDGVLDERPGSAQEWRRGVWVKRDLPPAWPDWLVEWTQLYNRMNEAQRWEMYKLLRSRLRQERWQKLAWLLHGVAGRWREFLRAPGGVLEQVESVPAGALRLPILQAMLTFLILAQLPRHPLSIPLALGLSAVVLVYVQIIAYAMGYRLR